LKPSVLDPQGKTVMHSLHSLGYEKISEVRVSKFIEITYTGNNRSEFEQDLENICSRVLANPNIEVYHYKIIDSDSHDEI